MASVKKVAFKFNPFRDVKVASSKKPQARAAIQKFVKKEVLSRTSEGKSPVAKGKWKKSLTPDYKRTKGKKGGSSFSDIRLSGDLTSALDVTKQKNFRLSLQVSGKQAGKADGNNRGTYGRSKPTSKKREFIPKSNQTFNQGIWDGINKIAKKFK